MPENTPNQQDINPSAYDAVQAPLRWMQQDLAEQGITVSPEEALNLHVQKMIHDIKRGMQQQLAKQGVTVSPDEAQELFEQKMIQDIKRGMQQELAEEGIEVSPDEAAAIDRLRFYHRLMKRAGLTDPPVNI